LDWRLGKKIKAKNQWRFKMKKILFVIILALLVFGQTFAQSRPIMGYDKVAWGSSVATVRRAYNFGNNTVLQEKYNNEPNIAALIQENVSDSILKRTFLFNNWRGSYQLYRVWVNYRDSSDAAAQNVLSSLTNSFGYITNFTNPEYLSSRNLPLNQKISVFGKYSPELDVELIIQTEVLILTSTGAVYTGEITADFIDDIFSGTHFRRTGEQFYLGEQKQLMVCYTWTKFRNEYQAR
jgi:hypothetical protein